MTPLALSPLLTPFNRLPQLGSLIDNKWVTTGNSMATYNPATEQKITDFVAAGQNEVNAAVAAARQAFYDPKSE